MNVNQFGTDRLLTKNKIDARSLFEIDEPRNGGKRKEQIEN